MNPGGLHATLGALSEPFLERLKLIIEFSPSVLLDAQGSVETCFLRLKLHWSAARSEPEIDLAKPEPVPTPELERISIM